jgi:hypothetical protein
MNSEVPAMPRNVALIVKAESAADGSIVISVWDACQVDTHGSGTEINENLTWREEVFVTRREFSRNALAKMEVPKSTFAGLGLFVLARLGALLKLER